MKYDPIVTVCSVCLRACCWQGEFMCGQAQGASTLRRNVSTLIGPVTFNDVVVGEVLEHPDWWNKDLKMGHLRQLTSADLRALGITDPSMLRV